MHTAVPVPGDVVWIRQRRWHVERARRDRNVVRLDVRHRDERLTFLAPFDRPAASERIERPRRIRPSHAVARLAVLVGRSFTWPALGGARDARIDLLPYQLEPAIAMLCGTRRILLADAVGLGKTIQAGVAIAELHRRVPNARTLVVVPASLRDQWIEELRGRFRLECRAVDRHELDGLGRRGSLAENPWLRPGVWIGSLDYLKQPHVMEGLPASPWDLLVVDEAHAACGDSERHEACSALARRARQVLLLSATPHNGEDARFDRLMNLGRLNDPGDDVTVFRRSRQSVGLANSRRVSWHHVALSRAEAEVFQVLADFEAAVLSAASATHRDDAILLLSVFRKRALSTMHALRVSLDRRLAWLGEGQAIPDFDWLQPQLAFEDDSDEMDETDCRSLSGDIGLRAAAERSWLRRLRGLAESAVRHDSKARRIAALIARAREPVVVFTEFRDSLDVVRRGLLVGAPVAVLHGGLTPLERRQQLGRFLDGAASVLLTTDVGGQGLNLQTRARWVINLELPWNPVRLEQRCGRVDRIGQTRPVHFTLTIARHPFEEGLLTRLARRALIASHTLGDDLMTGVLPDTVEIARSLFEGAAWSHDDHKHPPVRICRRWSRPAVALARRLLSQRLLLQRWRSPGQEAPAASWTPVDRLPLIRRVAGSKSLLVFSVPLIDGAGGVAERHIVAIRVEGLRWLQRDRVQVEAARAMAATALVARARRLTVRMRRLSAVRSRVEAALMSEVIEELAPDEVQPGLFDQRELRAFESLQRVAVDIQRFADDRRANWDREAGISVGRPVLELAFVAR